MHKITRAISVAILVLYIFTSGCERINAIAVNKMRGGAIVDALYSYKQDNGSFPNKLSLLVPKYLDVVPQTVNGDEFFYSVDIVNGFNLSFTVSKNYGCGLTDKSHEWECGYGD